MSFILTAQRHASPGAVTDAFRRYRAYLEARRSDFPPGAFALAASEWYYDAGEHRCPHDAWLESVTIEEPATGARLENRTVAIRIRLLGAYHDGRIELYYPRVYSYRLELGDGEQGHCDWRFDEFRLNDEGHLLHEIEWAGLCETSRWMIEASDVEFTWHPA